MGQKRLRPTVVQYMQKEDEVKTLDNGRCDQTI